jgi:GNAT superfamily N-acetyltransferase
MIVDRLRLGSDLFPVDDAERDAFLRAAGALSREDCPEGFAGHSAIWARDRDLLVGQAALVVLGDEALRARLAPRGRPDMAVAAIDALAVRAEYRETGLEERMVRRLVRGWARGGEGLVYVGSAHAPVLASTLAATAPAFGLLA